MFFQRISLTFPEPSLYFKTESNTSVELPKELVNKWKAEGRYDQEMKELNEFFSRVIVVASNIDIILLS